MGRADLKPSLSRGGEVVREGRVLVPRTLAGLEVDEACAQPLEHGEIDVFVLFAHQRALVGVGLFVGSPVAILVPLPCGRGCASHREKQYQLECPAA